MFKFVTAVSVFVMISFTALKAQVPAVMRGTYQGTGFSENLTGTIRLYDPIRIKITSTGIVTGTAMFKGKLIQFNGNLRNIRKSTYAVEAKVYGRFPDGSNWTATIYASRVMANFSSINGSIERATGDYLGTMSLLKL